VQKSRPELVAQQEIDVAQGKDLEASAGVSSSKDALAAAEQALLAAKAALDKDKALFAYARMTAPFEGVVTQIYAYTGALLPAGTSATKGDSALCHLSQNNLLRLVIPVPERAVPDISDGQTLEVNVSALHKTSTGKISLFSDQIDLTTRTMHTEVTVPNANYELVPGMYASVKIPLHTVTNVLTIPMQAVESTGTGQGIVLVVNSSNHLERREVKLGLQSATDTEVLSGLSENESVIFGEQNQFKEGQQVSPKLVTAPGME
jgi:RND family efflux transporter MFP subunit